MKLEYFVIGVALFSTIADGVIKRRSLRRSV